MTPRSPATPTPSRRCTPTDDRGLEFDVRTLVATPVGLGPLGGAAGRDRGRLHRRLVTGAGAGALALTGVEPPRSSAERRQRPARRPARAGRRHARRCPTRPAARTRATAPTAPTCSTTRASSGQRHPLVLRHLDDDGRGVPLTIKLTVRDAANGARADAGRRRLRLALRPRRAATRSTPQGVDGRELPARRAGDRRDGHGRRSRASSRPATRAAGRTSTSRSTRALAERRRRPAPIVKTSQIALPKDGLRRGLRDRPATSRASATSRRRRLDQRQASSATTAASTSSRP